MEFRCIWIHIIISYMNSYNDYMNSYVNEFIYMNSCMNSFMKLYELWIHMIFSCMNSYVSHVWIHMFHEFIHEFGCTKVPDVYHDALRVWSHGGCDHETPSQQRKTWTGTVTVTVSRISFYMNVCCQGPVRVAASVPVSFKLRGWC